MNKLISQKIKWSVLPLAALIISGNILAANLKPKDALDESKMGVAAKFVSITAGEFQMGSHSDEEGRDKDEKQHSVVLKHDFEIQATEVTQLQYFLIMGRNPSHFIRKKEHCDNKSYQVKFGLGFCANHPVEKVSFLEIQKFIKKLNKMQSEYSYRLPTEAEWEYAARGGMPEGFPYSFGFNDTELLKTHGWYSGNSKSRTHAVATAGGQSGKPGTGNANDFGLYDVHGNVWEWVQDNYGDYPSSSVTDPTGAPSGSHGVLRGGSWLSSAENLRSANRFALSPSDRYPDIGFRLLRTPR